MCKKTVHFLSRFIYVSIIEFILSFMYCFITCSHYVPLCFMNRFSSFSSKKIKPKPQKPDPFLLLPGIEAEEVDLAFEGGPGHVVAIDVEAEAKLKKTNLKVVFLRV